MVSATVKDQGKWQCQSQRQIKLENLGGNHGKVKSNRKRGQGEALDSWGLRQSMMKD